MGRKLENPYSIENMTKAIEQVRPSMLKSGEVLQPNFIYVRFLPKNYEEFELLYNDTTPMLHGSANFFHYNGDDFIRIISNVCYISTVNTSGFIISAMGPDIVLSYGESKVSSEQLSYIVFHEFAHASHYKKVGYEYWGKYVNYIITNNGYGDGKAIDADLCALGEMWGNQIGYDFRYYKYTTKYTQYIISLPIIYDTYLPSPKITDVRESGWIPKGLLCNMKDATKDTLRVENSIYLVDNVTGYTNAMFFNALDADIESPKEFKTRILSENSNLDKTDVEALFKAYYY